MRFVEYLLFEGAEYNEGQTVVLSPMIVGKKGGVGKVLSIKNDKIVVKNQVNGQIHSFLPVEVRDVDTAPEEWLTDAVEKLL